MKTIRAIFENGVFRPIGPVDLPEGSEVTLAPRQEPEHTGPSTHLKRIYSLLGQSEDTDDPGLAARHDQHQP
jgi:predicted DNA-binding antitoxin AbrB/MazE fold protein